MVYVAIRRRSSPHRSAAKRSSSPRSRPQYDAENGLRAHIVLPVRRGWRTTPWPRTRFQPQDRLLWRKRFAQSGLDGLRDRTRPGRKPALSAEFVQCILDTTLHEKPRAATHWSTRTLAKHLGVSKMAIQRVWKAHGLQPHRLETFKLSRDKQFVEKLRDVVGLYLNPPEHALVLSVVRKARSRP